MEDHDQDMESGNGSQETFPFQVFINVVPDSNCKIQKKLTKLKCTTHDSYAKTVEELGERLKVLKERSSANSKTQVSKIQNQLLFLESIEPYFKESRRSYFDPQTIQFLRHKNADFLYHSKGTSKLKSTKGMRRDAAIYFYPNLIATEQKEAKGNGRHYFYSKKLKTTQNKLLVAQLRFFFVDLDGIGAFEKVQCKIDEFKWKPDVVVQTSENSFHLYWSIHPVNMSLDQEGYDGSQLDKNRIAYEIALKALIKFFNADRARSNTNSLLRVPNTWNIKPQKKRRFYCQYIEGSQSLAYAVQNPRFDFIEFVDHVAALSKTEIWSDSEIFYSKNKPRLPSVDEISTKPLSEVQQFAEEQEKKVEYDFEKGWEAALSHLCEHFNVHSNYFDDNDLIIFRHMWKNRLRKVLYFHSGLRESLSGSGLKYSELKRSIEKIGILPRKIHRSKFQPLIVSSIPHRKPGKDKLGQLTGYTMSEEFMVACGRTPELDKTDATNRIYNHLYIKGRRNAAIPYDCFVLSKKLGFSIDEARQFLIEKIQRSATQSNADLRCSDDISNVEAWLRYYYK